MDRYDNLELDLECDGGGGGGVAQRASLFGGMFKKSTKSSSEQPLTDNVSLNGELSQSNESLTNNNNDKDKTGGFKGMFKKSKSTKDPAQVNLSYTNPELSISSDSLTENKPLKDKALAAPPKPPPRPGHLRRPSQDFLDFDRGSSAEQQTENTAKESNGMFGGMFKKSPKPETRRPSQDNLSTSSELSGSQDSLTVSNKEGGGMFSGMFKKKFNKTPSQDDLSDPSETTEEQANKEKGGGLFSGVFKKPKGAKTQSQEDLTGELSGSKEELSDPKEKGGILSGVFKKPKLGVRSQSKDDLSADDELSKSQENLTENTKEKGGILSGVFKKPKLGAKSQSKEDLTAEGELSNSQENLAENKEKAGFFGGMFKKPKGLGAKSQSQDDLSESSELSGSTDNLAEKSEKKGSVANFLKNPFGSSAQKEEKEEKGDKNESKDVVASTEKPKSKQNGFTAMMKNTFTSDKQDKGSDSDSEEVLDDGETQQNKQSKFAGAMNKLNPFRSAQKPEKTVDSSDDETKEKTEKSKEPKQKEAEEQETKEAKEEKPKTVRKKVSQFEQRDRSETILEPNRAKDQETTRTSSDDKAAQRGAGEKQGNKEMASREKRPSASETPAIPPRPSAEEVNRALKNDKDPVETVPKGRLYPTLNKSDDEALNEEKSAEDKDGEKKPVKVRRPKHHNPFMPRTGAKLAAVETAEEAKESENDEEENKEEEGGDKAEAKAKKPKRRNPFMPQVKAKANKKKDDEEGEKSLFDKLEEFRFEPSQPENSEDSENLMEWWNTVDTWEDTPQFDDMTPKEEANLHGYRAFAVTAEKIQKGIRVFNKLFSERAESLWQHVIDLNSIADGLDKFNKKTKIAQITGGSTSATGGVLTITGLALAPVTMGTSLIVTAVGLGIATAGGLTSAGAGISNQVNNSMDRKKVEKIVEDYQEKMVDLNKALKFIQQGIENLRQFDLIKMKKHAYNNDFPALTSRFYEDGAMAGKAILINANEIMRVVQIANVAGSTAARAVQIASMATGVLTGLFVGMDIYFVAKDSKELKKGAKSEFAGKIREVAQQLHDGLVELNTIREELQATTKPESQNQEGAEEKKEEEEKKEVQYSDEEEEDEIDKIKKQMKKDYESREWV